MDVLAGITVSIVAAAGLAFVARTLGQPLLLGYILAGAVLGPHVGFGVIHDEAAIEHIAEIGLILLLFLIGLEISIPRLLQAGRVIIARSRGVARWFRTSAKPRRAGMPEARAVAASRPALATHHPRPRSRTALARSPSAERSMPYGSYRRPSRTA